VYDTGPTEERYTFMFPNPEQPDLLELKTRYGLEGARRGQQQRFRTRLPHLHLGFTVCGHTTETMNPASRTH
jgi:hypothetical protein